MDNYTVYKHTSPCNKVYIGITSTSVERRWQNGNNYRNSPHFKRAIAKYGWDNIRHDILFTGLTKEEAEKKEIELIAEYNSTNPLHGYNTESGGNSIGKLSDAQKAHISQALRGKHYEKRRCHTEEEKRKISEKLKGRISPNKGIYWSDEKKAKYGYQIVCVQTGERFCSIREAARKTGLDRANIARVLKGIYKQTGGMSFEYDRKQSLSIL